MNTTALITGASSGIGLELAKIHASKGGNLVLAARSISKLESLKKVLEESYKVSVHIIQKDLSLPDAGSELYNEIKKQNIQVEYLINNAGFGDYGFFHEGDSDKQIKMLNLNIIALTELTRLFLSDMVKRGSGKIMNVASTAAFQAGPLMAVYYASKAYVLSFSEAINEEVRDKGITVTALCPGPTVSGFQEAAGIGENKLFSGRKLPDSRRVAEFGYSAMMKGKAVAIEGCLNKILAFSGRFLPRSIVVKTVKRIQEKRK